MKRKLPDTLPAPDRHPDIPTRAKWLAGEGAGSWFSISSYSSEDEFEISRLSPNGTVECHGIFRANEELKLNLPFAIDFPSNCMKVTVVQNHHRIGLQRK